MWSHYADHHKEFCIEFDRLPNNLLGNFEITRPVTYSCDYPKLNFFDSNGIPDSNTFQETLFYKTKGWVYEKGWRLIYEKGGREEPMSAGIFAIVFGLKMPCQHKRTIKNILVDQPKIRYQQAVEAEESSYVFTT